MALLFNFFHRDDIFLLVLLVPREATMTGCLPYLSFISMHQLTKQLRCNKTVEWRSLVAAHLHRIVSFT